MGGPKGGEKGLFIAHDGLQERQVIFGVALFYVLSLRGPGTMSGFHTPIRRIP